MNDDDKLPNEIPVLREAVSRRRADSQAISQEELDNLRAQLSADIRTLVDELLAEGLTEAAATLRLQINDRLDDELARMIDRALHARFGKTDTD
jgi:hypothetical protein